VPHIVKAPTVPHILLLASDPQSSPAFLEFQLQLRRALSQSMKSDVELNLGFLDLVDSQTPELRQKLAEVYRVKYAERPPEVVLAFGPAALKFALEERLFPDVPVMFTHLEKREAASMDLPKNVGGVVCNLGFDSEVDTALRLLPDTQHIVVIIGSGVVERLYQPLLQQDFARFDKRVDFAWWAGMPMQLLQERIAALPPHTAVIYTAVSRDSSGGTFVPMQVLQDLAERSSAPIFSRSENYVGEGIVGDGRYSYALLGTQTGEQAARLLKGERPESIGIADARLALPDFDARQLDRWHIRRDRLPPGSRVSFERLSLWQSNRPAVVLGASAIAILAALVVALIAMYVARRRAEGAEEQSQSLYRSVVDSIDERVAIISRDGTVVTANRAWRQFAHVHHTDEQLAVGSNYLLNVAQAIERGQIDARRTLENLVDVLAGRATSRRVEYSSPVGGDHWRYDIRVTSLQSPNGGAVVSIRDITDQWRSEERVRVALESLPFATLLMDASGVVELVNAEAERLFGYPRNEMVDRCLTDMIPEFVCQEEGQPRTQECVAQRLVTGRRSDGTELPLQMNLRTIEMASRTMILASIIDLSERRRLDSEVQRLREETAHFGRVTMAGEMSAAIAHELNQPLTGIMMNCQAAQRLLEDGNFTAADVIETFSDIVADTRRAGEVIQRLRLMLRKSPAESRLLDINEVVTQVVRLAAHDMAMKGAALDLELTNELAPVVGDRVHLQQVILNLLVNGADAMVAVPPEARRMVLRTRPGIHRTIEIELRDAGPGISAEAMPHMFEPFFTTKKSGMGIGLSIVRSIVETHSGKITCANAASGGAVFTVTLPARERDAA
jgi:two-component system, LuxR family, sensor kinase FixL